MDESNIPGTRWGGCAPLDCAGVKAGRDLIEGRKMRPFVITLIHGTSAREPPNFFQQATARESDAAPFTVRRRRAGEGRRSFEPQRCG